ncbi:serine/threonine-protein kinase [Amnibacterium sp.]|uniref:serine/threonine-protein kinase n=1 Tax=Amnibacterium sp. TaxID=1872496 RepID=UPI003F7B6F35
MGAPQELIAGRYRLQRRLAAGGMGVVWEATDELLRRPVAVKQLRTQPGVTEEEADLAKQRAMREARITARLHHPHAVPVFDSVEHDGEPCLVMQYVPSEPLSARIKRRGPLPSGEVARIGAEVAGALAAAHALGIVHRDVKPGNILIADEDGAAMLSDFGISHALGDASLTSTGFMHGTPAYLAPEVARGEESTFASDVFSLGSTLYAASEGRAPFGEEPNSIAVLHRVAVGGFQAPTDSGPLGPLLLRMMRSDPEARPTMREVARRLAALQEELGEDLVPTLPVPAEADSDGADPDPDQPTAWVPVERDDPSTLVAAPVEADGTVAAAMSAVPAEAAEAPPVDAARTDAEPRESEATATDPVQAPVTERAAVPPVGPPPMDAAAAGVPPEPNRRSRRRAVVVAVTVVVVLLAVLALGLVLTLLPGSPTAVARTSSPPTKSVTTPSPAPTPSSTPSATPTPSSTPTSTPTSSPSATPTSKPAPAETPAATIEHYYTLVPRNTAAAWPLMTAAYQSGHAGGRASYDAFWAQVRSVTATNVRRIADDRVEATLTYRRDSGVSVENTVFRLVREGGVWKIADSAVVG